MKTPSTTAPTSTPTAEQDRAALHTVIDRRLALRLGLSLPVAAVVAQLAGLGPREARR